MTQIQIRRGTAALWASNNPTLALGEIGYETDTKKAKIGDGATTWNLLGYWHPTMPTGEVVGTTDAQAITNKDLSSTVNPNTFPTRLQRQVTTITAPTTLLGTHAEHLTYCSTSDTATSSLLHFDGANNSTTITDSGQVGTNWQVSGNAKLSTANAKFGTACLTLDGTLNTYVYPTYGTNPAPYNFGTGDFCIEMWIRPTTIAGYGRIFYDSRPPQTTGATGAYPCLYIDPGTSTIRYYALLADRITSTTALSLNTWYHVALSRSGTSTRLFLNGVQQGSTYTDTTNYLNYGERPRIGANGNLETLDNFIGQIDEVRISKGVARYTANFTAPTSAFTDPTVGTPTLPTAVGNTSSYVLKNTSLGPVAVGTTSAQTIDGGTLSIPPGGSVRLDSDGSNWRADFNDTTLYNKVMSRPTFYTPAVDGLADSFTGVGFASTAPGLGWGFYMNNGHCINARPTAHFQSLDTTAGTQTVGITRPFSANGGYIIFQGGGTTTGGIGTTNNSTTYYNTSSDYRLKENVTDLTDGLDTVAAVRPVKYEWKRDGSYGEGFIAHELQAVVPEAVVGEKDAVDASGDIVPQGVDPGKLVVHLVSAVQELKARLEAAEAEITQLKGGTP